MACESPLMNVKEESPMDVFSESNNTAATPPTVTSTASSGNGNMPTDAENNNPVGIEKLAQLVFQQFQGFNQNQNTSVGQGQS